MKTPSMDELLNWVEATFPDARASIAPMQYTVVVVHFPEGNIAFDRREAAMNTWEQLKDLVQARRGNHLTPLADEPTLISGD